MTISNLVNKKTCNKENIETSKQKNKKTISNIFWNGLMILNIIVWASLIITYFINGRDFCRANVLGFRPVFVLSQSMEPTLDTHAMAICKMNTEYEVGDIVVYEQEVNGQEILIIHRIIEEYDDGTYQTKGDNNSSKDPWTITEEQIVGKVVLVCNEVAPIVDFVMN